MVWSLADFERETGGVRLCVLGVGNRERRDDGIGSVVAGRLAARFGDFAIDAGMVPENYLEKAARRRSEIVLLVDAVDFAGCDGEVRLLDPGGVADGGLSSHALSLKMAAEYLRTRTDARLLLLAIQPADLGHGEGLSKEVARAADDIEATLSRLAEAERICAT